MDLGSTKLVNNLPIEMRERERERERERANWLILIM